MPVLIRKNTHKNVFGNILLSQILQQLKQAGQRMQFACSVIRPSADAALQVQQLIFWDILARASRTGIQASVVINKSDDDRRGALKAAQKAIAEEMLDQQELKSDKKLYTYLWINVFQLPQKNVESVITF